MSSLNTEEQTLAKHLAHARSTGTNVQPQTSPANLDRAYAIQNEVSRLLGGTSRGWKVGSTSRAAQERLGTSEPGAGRLLTPWVYVSGESVPVSAQHDAQVEVEFGFVMGTTLSPRAEPYTAADVRAAIASFVPALEIVGSRLERGLAGSGRELVTADGGANIGFVYGDPFKCDTDADFAHTPAPSQSMAAKLQMAPVPTLWMIRLTFWLGLQTSFPSAVTRWKLGCWSPRVLAPVSSTSHQGITWLETLAPGAK